MKPIGPKPATRPGAAAPGGARRAGGRRRRPPAGSATQVGALRNRYHCVNNGADGVDNLLNWVNNGAHGARWGQWGPMKPIGPKPATRPAEAAPGGARRAGGRRRRPPAGSATQGAVLYYIHASFLRGLAPLPDLRRCNKAFILIDFNHLRAPGKAPPMQVVFLTCVAGDPFPPQASVLA